MILFLCSSCKRHVRAPRCPFCGSTRGWAPKRSGIARLTRGLVMVGGAFTLSCGDRTDLGDVDLDRDASVDAADAALDVCRDAPNITVYGAPPKKCP